MTKSTTAADIAVKVLAALKKRYRISRANLEFSNPWELLVATILSAQCTDARVNSITPGLFRLWPGPRELALAPVEKLEEVIHSAGFYHNKAKNLLACAKMVNEKYSGVLPKTIDELVKLPGVARKTANVVLFGAYGINAGIAVDTHVKRISYRLGLTEYVDPVKIEVDLMGLFPQNEWGNVNHRMVWFGRDVCRARNPDCDGCEMKGFCPRKEPPKNNAGQ